MMESLGTSVFGGRVQLSPNGHAGHFRERPSCEQGHKDSVSGKGLCLRCRKDEREAGRGFPSWSYCQEGQDAVHQPGM